MCFLFELPNGKTIIKDEKYKGVKNKILNTYFL